MDSSKDSNTLNSSAYDGLEICIGHDSVDYNKVLILSKNKVVDKLVSAKILGSNCDFTVVSTKLTSDGESERTDKLKVVSQNLIQGVFNDGEFGFQCAELVKNRDDFQMTFNMPLDMLWAHLTGSYQNSKLILKKKSKTSKIGNSPLFFQNLDLKFTLHDISPRFHCSLFSFSI